MLALQRQFRKRTLVHKCCIIIDILLSLPLYYLRILYLLRISRIQSLSRRGLVSSIIARARLVLHAVGMVSLLAVALIFIDITPEVCVAINRIVYYREIDIGLRMIHMTTFGVVS